MTLSLTVDDVTLCKLDDVTLCKLDVNVKNRTAAACSVGCFNFELKLFKGKSVTYSEFYFENQMW